MNFVFFFFSSLPRTAAAAWNWDKCRQSSAMHSTRSSRIKLIRSSNGWMMKSPNIDWHARVSFTPRARHASTRVTPAGNSTELRSTTHTCFIDYSSIHAYSVYISSIESQRRATLSVPLRPVLLHRAEHSRNDTRGSDIAARNTHALSQSGS